MVRNRSQLALVPAVLAISTASCAQLDPPDPGGRQDGPEREATSGPSPVDDEWEDAGTIDLPITGSPGRHWDETLTFPYGDSEDTLGTSPGGHEGQPRAVGPEYGAQAPDGSWWFLDAAHRRVARFDESGEYLDQVELGPDELAQGRFFQYQLPRVLADGTLVAVSYTGEHTNLLRVRDGDADVVTFSESVLTVVADDGEDLYGFDSSAQLNAIDVHDGSRSTVGWLASRGGDRMRVGVMDDELRLELPEQEPAVRRRWSVAAEDTGESVAPSMQMTTDEHGRIHLLLIGHTDDDARTQLSAYVRLSASGDLERVEPTPELFSEADPGSPAHLGVRPGGTTPWLMTVGSDEVRVVHRQR